MHSSAWNRRKHYGNPPAWQRPHDAAYPRRAPASDRLPSVLGPALRHQPQDRGQETGPNPTDRGKLGSKRHIVVDARGIPLVILVSGANRHDSKMFERCVDAIPAIAGLPGRPRRRPAAGASPSTTCGPTTRPSTRHGMAPCPSFTPARPPRPGSTTARRSRNGSPWADLYSQIGNKTKAALPLR